MKRQSNAELFLKANLYLFQPNMVIYWLSLSLLSTLIIMQNPSGAENNFSNAFFLGLKGAVFILFYYKVIDCMVLILARKEKVPFKPAHKFTLPLSIRYFLTLFLITSLGLALPGALAFLFLLFLFFITPAMLITLLLNHRVIEMLRPINWKTAIDFVGKSKYFAMLYMPLLATIVSIMAGLFALTAGGGGEKIPDEKVIFSALLLQSFLTPYLIALQMIYCAFMMQQPNISDQELRVLEEKINSTTKPQEVKTMEIHLEDLDLSKEQSASVLFDNFPLEPSFFKFLKQELKESENGYTQLKPQLEKRIKESFAELSPQSTFLLIEIATEQEDFPFVLFLTQDFKKRFVGKKNIVEVGFYAAQALDKTGDREGSIALLKSLIEEFNRFYPGMNRVKRAYQILTDKNQ